MKKICIVGAGIFGITLALMLSKNKNIKIDLYEKNKDILSETSLKNQQRFHLGYHYPRSKKTILEIKSSSVDFNKFYGNKFYGNTNNIYAISKISNEMMSDYYFKEFGVNSIGIRFFSIYGPMGREDMSYYKFLNDIKRKKEIIVNGDGSIKRSFTHVDDAVECLFRLIKFYKNKKRYKEIFNIGNSKTITIKKIIEIIKGNIGTSFKIKYKKKFGVDNMVTRCDTKKLFKVIKFKPKIDIKEGLVNFIKWFNENK